MILLRCFVPDTHEAKVSKMACELRRVITMRTPPTICSVFVVGMTFTATDGEVDASWCSQGLFEAGNCHGLLLEHNACYAVYERNVAP
jgi:hypothetical protein